ncbi:MAG: hypothetical protein ACI8ZM_003366 [Crocinitomix sp.]|jgi:hypothetical protein
MLRQIHWILIFFTIALSILSCEANTTYITMSGTHYWYDKLEQHEIVDSVEKRFTIKIVENSKKENEILHFQQINTFVFYQFTGNSAPKNSNWILGKINFQNKIRESLILEDSLIIESVYEPFSYDNSTINNEIAWSANHYGTVRLYIKTPDYNLTKGSGTELWANGPSFRSSISISWKVQGDKIIGEQKSNYTGNSNELKMLVGGVDQVLVEYIKEF